jgi:hypothetical protein
MVNSIDEISVHLKTLSALSTMIPTALEEGTSFSSKNNRNIVIVHIINYPENLVDSVLMVNFNSRLAAQ